MNVFVNDSCTNEVTKDFVKVSDVAFTSVCKGHGLENVRIFVDKALYALDTPTFVKESLVAQVFALGADVVKNGDRGWQVHV